MMNFYNGYKKASFYGRQNFANVEMKCHNITTNIKTRRRIKLLKTNGQFGDVIVTKIIMEKTAKGFLMELFSGTHLSPKQIFEFFYWCRKTHNQKEYIHDMGLAAQTVVDWCMFSRPDVFFIIFGHIALIYKIET